MLEDFVARRRFQHTRREQLVVQMQEEARIDVPLGTGERLEKSLRKMPKQPHTHRLYGGSDFLSLGRRPSVDVAQNLHTIAPSLQQNNKRTPRCLGIWGMGGKARTD